MLVLSFIIWLKWRTPIIKWCSGFITNVIQVLNLSIGLNCIYGFCSWKNCLDLNSRLLITRLISYYILGWYHNFYYRDHLFILNLQLVVIPGRDVFFKLPLAFRCNLQMQVDYCVYISYVFFDCLSNLKCSFNCVSTSFNLAKLSFIFKEKCLDITNIGLNFVCMLDKHFPSLVW